MIVIEWFLLIFSWLFFVTGAFIIFSCFIGTTRYKDFFIRAHAIKISNIYGITFMLISLGLFSHDLLTFLQLFLMAILNILITITVEHSICRLALNNNITHGGFSRRKYNEMLSQKEKEEAEKRMKERMEMERAKLAEAQAKAQAAAAASVAQSHPFGTGAGVGIPPMAKPSTLNSPFGNHAAKPMGLGGQPMGTSQPAKPASTPLNPLINPFKKK